MVNNALDRVSRWNKVSIKTNADEIKEDLLRESVIGQVFALLHGSSGTKVSKTFFKPQVIPPVHSC